MGVGDYDVIVITLLFAEVTSVAVVDVPANTGGVGKDQVVTPIFQQALKLLDARVELDLGVDGGLDMPAKLTHLVEVLAELDRENGLGGLEGVLSPELDEAVVCGAGTGEGNGCGFTAGRQK